METTKNSEPNKKIQGRIIILLILIVAITVYFASRHYENPIKVSVLERKQLIKGDSTTNPLRDERTETPIGLKPKQNASDGSVEIVKEFIKLNSKNPSSIEFFEWSKVTSSGQYWIVRCKYKGTSAFNAEVTTNSWFYIQSNKIVHTKIISKI